MNINVKCPYCNQITGYDNSQPSAFCMMCGKQISLGAPAVNNVQPTVPVTYQMPVQTLSGSGNLIISFSSEHPRVFLISTILATGESYQYSNGQSMIFNLVPGIHSIDFKIGKRTYRRDLIIPPNGEHVRVHASWARGTARITILNPTQPGSAPVMYV